MLLVLGRRIGAHQIVIYLSGYLLPINMVVIISLKNSQFFIILSMQSLKKKKQVNYFFSTQIVNISYQTKLGCRYVIIYSVVDPTDFTSILYYYM